MAPFPDDIRSLKTEELIKQLVDYPFPNSPFSKRDIRERDLSEVAKTISEKIQTYLRLHPDQELYQLIAPKVKLSLKEYLELEANKELLHAKTIKSLVEDKKASTITLDILRAFLTAVKHEQENKRHLARLEGLYNIYNLHSRENQRQFQISNFELNLDGEVSLTYQDERFKPKKQQVEVEIIGNDKIYINHREENFLLSFLGFIGSIETPNYIQCVYFYNNDRQVFASLAVFERVNSKANIYPQPPMRMQDNLPANKQNIQIFLLNRAKFITPLLHHNNFPFDFTLWQKMHKHLPPVCPGPYQTEAHLYYHKQQSFIGNYRIFFPERFTSAKDFIPNNRFATTVGKGFFAIQRDKKSGVLTCKMYARKNTRDELLTYEGYVMNNELNSDAYLMFTLYNKPEKDRALSMIFNVVDDNKFIGCYNIMYSPPGQLSSGIVILARDESMEEDSDFDETSREKVGAMVVNPLSQEENLPNLERSIINYLSRKNNVIVVPPSFQKLIANYRFKFHGTYRMYSYGKNNGIRVGALKIYENGFAKHKGFSSGNKPIAYGIAEINRSVMNITLQNIDNGRIGFCSVKVESIAPEAGTIYCGTFCGVTRRGEETPIASLFILEYLPEVTDIEEVDTTLIESSDPETTAPEAVQNIIKGKTNNFIVAPKNAFNLEDLQKEEKEDFGEIYLRAALLEEREKTANQLFYLSKAHGCDDDKIESAKKGQAETYAQKAVYYAIIGEKIKQNKFLVKANQLYPDTDWDEYINKVIDNIGPHYNSTKN